MRHLGWLLAAALFAVPASADDEIKLKNGDRLSGTLKNVRNKKIQLQTKHSGLVVIDTGEIEDLKTTTPVRLETLAGVVYTGRVEAVRDGKLVVVVAEGQEPELIPLDELKHVNVSPVEWKGVLSLAVRATDGNTHVQSGLATAMISRVTEWDEAIVRGVYRRAKRSGELEEENAYGIAKYSYKFLPHLYAYASLELLHDKFKDLRLQSITSVGLGSKLLDEKWIEFAVEAGVTYVDNDFDELQEDEEHAGARASAMLRVDLPLGFVLRDVFTAYPNFEDSQDYTARNELTLNNEIGSGWSLVGGVITEYDNEPAPGAHRHDNTYFAGLGYSF